MSFQHLPPNRPSPHYRLARETDVHPLAKVAGRRNPCDLGYGDVGEVERIGGLLDEAALRFGDDAIASGRGDDRRQVRAVRFRALLGGNGEAVGQLDELGALPLIDTAIIEHPIERVEILKQRFVGRRVVCVGDDAGQVAGWGPRRFPPQRSWTGGIRDMADRRGSGVAPHVGGEVARELGSCPGVGERPMLQAQLDSESGARDAELVSRGSERAQTGAAVEGNSQSFEFAGKHPCIERQVVRDEGPAIDPARNCGGDLTEHGRGLHHRRRDAMHADRSEIALGVDERVVLVDGLQCPRVERERRDFDDAIAPAEPGRLAVDNDKQWLGPFHSVSSCRCPGQVPLTLTLVVDGTSPSTADSTLKRPDRRLTIAPEGWPTSEVSVQCSTLPRNKASRLR